MKATISNVHDSHGSVFTLNLRATNSIEDQEVIISLKNCLNFLNRGSESVGLYAYGIRIEENMVSFDLTEGVKHLAKIESLWNHWREDQRFVVLKTPGDPKNNPDGNYDHCPHFVCHVCGNETWGVSRDNMETYDSKLASVKTVTVHQECKINRLKEVETSYAEA